MLDLGFNLEDSSFRCCGTLSDETKKRVIANKVKQSRFGLTPVTADLKKMLAQI